MHTDLITFAARLRGYMEPYPRVPEEFLFETMALDLFARQFAHNPVYQKIATARKLTPATVKHWTEIPAVPTALFKELEVTSLPLEERSAVFHSSGTTEQKPSRHFHCAESLAVYEASLWPWFKANVVPQTSREEIWPVYLSLTPPADQAPRSSLIHMFDHIRQRMGLESQFVFHGTIQADGGWQIDFSSVQRAMLEASQAGQPVLLVGTAFSFVHWLDHCQAQGWSFGLPAGSKIMETGGYKNRSRTMPKEELHALLVKCLGVPQAKILCEYGMSELSSQAYAIPDKIGGSFFHFPPWARVVLTSPETGQEVAEGEVGLIRIVDLANVFSVAAIQTEDLGIRRGDGFTLIGRAAEAEPRGCSLMAR
ncbi:MAG TPA: hypothetical protein VF607_10560 [Verrucomicrobiae bacterium]